MKVTFRDHDGKGRLLGDALRDAGHELVPNGGEVALVDHDQRDLPHDRVMVYPHGGGNPFAGKEWPPHPNTICRFVPGQGQADVLTACSYPVQVEVIGWPFSDRLPFRPCDAPVDVLFAPLHRLGNGWMPTAGAASNSRIHDMLASLPINLTVRYPCGDLEAIGITPRPGVTYRQVPLDVHDGLEAIAAADVVVAGAGTFPSLAIAQGCPTVMTAQIAPDDHDTVATSWDLYKDDARYPYDADDTPNTDALMGLLFAACRDDTDIAVWRDRFVGPPFDPERFVKIFEAAA